MKRNSGSNTFIKLGLEHHTTGEKQRRMAVIE
jgi:hypothetical protein